MHTMGKVRGWGILRNEGIVVMGEWFWNGEGGGGGGGGGGLIPLYGLCFLEHIFR